MVIGKYLVAYFLNTVRWKENLECCSQKGAVIREQDLVPRLEIQALDLTCLLKTLGMEFL